MYQHPGLTESTAQPGPDGLPPPLPEDSEFFSDFVDDVAVELNKYGRVDEINVCANLGEHLFGNAYIKYRDEDDAAKAMKALSGRWYRGQLLQPELSPVTDFREARCKQFDSSGCCLLYTSDAADE